MATRNSRLAPRRRGCLRSLRDRVADCQHDLQISRLKVCPGSGAFFLPVNTWSGRQSGTIVSPTSESVKVRTCPRSSFTRQARSLSSSAEPSGREPSFRPEISGIPHWPRLAGRAVAAHGLAREALQPAARDVGRPKGAPGIPRRRRPVASSPSRAPSGRSSLSTSQTTSRRAARTANANQHGVAAVPRRRRNAAARARWRQAGREDDRRRLQLAGRSGRRRRA